MRYVTHFVEEEVTSELFPRLRAVVACGWRSWGDGGRSGHGFSHDLGEVNCPRCKAAVIRRMMKLNDYAKEVQ